MMGGRAINSSPPQGTTNSAPASRAAAQFRPPVGVAEGKFQPRPDPAGYCQHPRRATTASASHVPRFARAFAKASLFRCVAPFSALRAGVNKAEKIAFANSCPALSVGRARSRAGPPRRYPPRQQLAGFLLRPSASHPCGRLPRAALPGGAPAAAAQPARPLPVGLSGAPRARRLPRSPRRSALRASRAGALCLPAPRLLPLRWDTIAAGCLARVGLLVLVSRSARFPRSRAGLCF